MISLAQDDLYVEAQTGNCNTIATQQEDGTTTKTGNCNNNINRENGVDEIEKRISSTESTISSNVKNNTAEKQIN